MIELKQSTKKHDRNGEKSRIWIEEPKSNRFLYDNGFPKGARYRIELDQRVARIFADPTGPLKVLGKKSPDGSADRSILDITRQRHQLPEFYPNGTNALSIVIEQGLITVTVIAK